MDSFSWVSTAVKMMAIILIFILVLIAALLACSENRHTLPAKIGGNEPSDRHSLGKALHEVRMKQSYTPGSTHVVSPPDHALRPPSYDLHHYRGGEAKKKPSKNWTQYKTWEALDKDRGALDAYWDDVLRVYDLKLDWTKVRKALSKIVYDDREWAGRINFVDGQLEVVELVPSPYAVGEGPLDQQTAAMVPAEVMQKLEAKTGLFIFHTHPGEESGSSMPSAIDMCGAMHMGFSNRYAAELVVSPYGVFMYGPSLDLRDKIWSFSRDDPHRKDKAHLKMMRQVADLLGAFDGARSWKSPWSLEDYSQLARRYGVEYNIFPNDNYVHINKYGLFTSYPEVDHDVHQNYIARILQLESEAETQKIVPSMAQLNTGTQQRIRFIPDDLPERMRIV